MESPKTLLLSTVLSAVCLSNAVTATRVSDSVSWFLSFSGSALVTSSLHKRTKLSDLSTGFKGLIDDMSDGLNGLLPEHQVRSALLAVLPEPLITAAQAMETAASDTSWVGPFMRRSRLVLGASGSGKTTWMLYEVYEAVDRGDEVVVCDMDYGSAHEGSDPNYWLGLPTVCIRYGLEAIYQTVTELSALVDLRADSSATGQRSDWGRKTLVLDEFPSVRRRVEAEMGKDRLASFDNALRNLLSRGLKQRVTFIAGSQNPDVASTGVKLTDLNQTNILFLGNFTTDQRVLALYGTKDEAAGCVEQAKAIASMGRVAVIKMDGDTKAVLLPDIDPSQMEVVAPELENPVNRWVDDVREDVLKLKGDGVSLTKVAKTYPESANVRNNNPYYLALKYLYKEVDQ